MIERPAARWCMTVQLFGRKLVERATSVPPQNFGRRKEAIRADGMDPLVIGRRPRRRIARHPPLTNLTQDESAHASARSLAEQEQILQRRGIRDAPKLVTLAAPDVRQRPWSATEASRACRSSSSVDNANQEETHNCKLPMS